MKRQVQQLDPTRRSFQSQRFEKKLRGRIVGQEEGVRALVDLYQVFCAGMCPQGRPVGNLLFLGPTGSGKTRIVEAAAEILFGDPRAVIKVDCAEFQHSHEIAKLTLGDNRRLDLSATMIFLTSNLGGGEITELMTGGLGFVQPADKGEDKLDSKVERTATEAAKRKFSPEFMNRLDKVVVFHPLRPEQLEQILEIELGMVQQRVLERAQGQFLFRVTPQARAYLVREGTDLKYGARHLKRAIERHIVYPLANLLATEQVQLGDMLCIDWDASGGRLIFEKEGEVEVLPVAAPQPQAAVQAAEASSGRAVEAPSTAVAHKA